jgi:hypothetical protein
MDKIRKDLEGDQRGKKSLDLWTAYKVVAKEYDLDSYKSMLIQHEQDYRRQAEEEAKREAERQAKATEREEKKKVKDARKSVGGKGDGDVEMKDAEAKKGDKKRKKSMGDGADDDQVSCARGVESFAVVSSDWSLLRKSRLPRSSN